MQMKYTDYFIPRYRFLKPINWRKIKNEMKTISHKGQRVRLPLATQPLSPFLLRGPKTFWKSDFGLSQTFRLRKCNMQRHGNKEKANSLFVLFSFKIHIYVFYLFLKPELFSTLVYGVTGNCTWDSQTSGIKVSLQPLCCLPLNKSFYS